MKSFKCSILMCVYDGDTAPGLAAALESLLKQTLPPDEIILVEDGPLPEALSAVISAAAERFCGEFRVHRLVQNAGLIIALNEGLRLCRGELLFRMDADDVSHPERLARQVAFMDANPDIGVLGTAMEEFIDDPNEPLRFKPVKEDHRQIRRQLVWRNPVNHPTVCIRRALLPETGYPHLRYLEDYFLWARLIAHGIRFHNLPEALLFYRFDDQTLKRRSGWLNFRNEVYLRWWMYRNGLVNAVSLSASIVVQAILRFSPLAIQRRLWVSTRRRLGEA